MRHLGEHVGSFWVAEKAGGAGFTADDEELLVLFSAQAAVAIAIANARALRDERRARADLDALVDTSPVGVVVFDAATARPVSLNREARRIVERLRQPGHTTEDLLDVVTCRRADGSELALGAFPLAAALRSAERLRAERSCSRRPTGPASPPCSARPPWAATAGSRPSWSRFRTSPRSRSSTACSSTCSAW